MQGRELEELIVKVLAEAEHPRIANVHTLRELRGENAQIGVKATDTDGSEGLCLAVQVSQGGKRVHAEPFEIPQELR